MSKPRPLDQTANALFNDSHFENLLRYNQFIGDVEFIRHPCWDPSIEQGKVIDDDDLTNIRYFLSRTHGMEPSKQITGEACYLLAKQKPYHPVKDFIQSVSWDGVGRIDEWLIRATGCENNILNRQIGAKFLIAAVNRVYHPGCKFDHMMILEGNQGIGKSTMIEELVKPFYVDTTFETKDKDLIDIMRPALIVEISELSGMTKKEVDWLKGFITRKVDRIRLAYASRAKDFKRKSVFVGTYNPSGNNTYLRDDTGNRRFWPVECVKINIPYVVDNRSQLWAEAFARIKERYYIDDVEAIEIMASLHKDRELSGPADIKIARWLSEQGVQQITMTEIIEDCLGINIKGKSLRDMSSDVTIVGIIMRKLGWRKGTNKNRDKYFSPTAILQENDHATDVDDNSQSDCGRPVVFDE